MNVLIVDTETTGLDPTKDQLVEVACVLWSVEHKTEVACWSTLIADPGIKNEGAFRANRIPAGSWMQGMPMHAALEWFRIYEQWSEIIVAHNAEFDRSFLAAHRVGIDKPWVCTMEDFAWPNGRERGFSSVVALAVAHDVGVTRAHRALTDCLLLSQLFTKVAETHDFPAMLARAMRPKALYRACAPYEERAAVKARGFKWDAAKKLWLRRMAAEDAESPGFFPFEVRQVLEAR